MNKRQRSEEATEAEPAAASDDKPTEKTGGAEEGEKYVWADLWPRLVKQGWTYVKASHPLHDWYYCMPGVNHRDHKKFILGFHYFLCPEDTMAYLAKREEREKAPPMEVPAGAEWLCDSQGLMQIPGPYDEPHDSSKPRDPAKPPASSAGSSPADGGDSYNFKCLWPRLLAAGWKHCKAGRVNPLHDWYYCRPGANPAEAGSVLGVHYFMSEEDVVAYARSRDGAESDSADARGPAEFDAKARSAEAEEGEARAAASGTAEKAAKSGGDGGGETDPFTPSDCRTRPQDPAMPLASAPGSSASDGSDFYNFKSLWPRLQTAGWRHCKAGKVNPLDDWYYCRPGVNPAEDGSVVGTHYFLSEEDVVAFVRRCDEADAKLTSSGTGLLV